MDGGTTTGDDLLSILHASARNGTLISSCEPEVKELMHQLDILISARCGELEGQVSKLRSLLKQKDHELQLLQDNFSEKEAKEGQLKRAASRANSRETEYRAHFADCEAQLVRLRSQLTHISHNYELSKEKHHHQTAKLKKKIAILETEKSEQEACERKSREAKQLLTKGESDHEEKESEVCHGGEGSNGGHSSSSVCEGTERMLKEIESSVEKRILEEEGSEHYIPLEPMGAQETAKLLTGIVDAHFQQLNQELLNIFDTS